MSIETILLIICCVLLCVLIGISLTRNTKGIEEKIKDMEEDITESKTILDYTRKDIENYERNAVNNMQVQANSSRTQMESLTNLMTKNIEDMQNANFRSYQNLSNALQVGMKEIRSTNEVKLNEIEGKISEKLDKSLNERLDSNFEKVSNQLGELYKSLGELDKMQTGITSLNKTLTNVKTRGTWGEIQLDDILKETMQPNQYERNVKLKEKSDDLVEFAIKIPSKDDSSTFLYMPIDSKFPVDRYLAVVEASEQGDMSALESARKDLATHIQNQAKTIRDKYIDPPYTTDFAILFLPTESMYAEVLSINGLAETCQNKYRIVISGPSTITALLNSLRVGFENLTLSKKTQEVRNILSAVKTQYNTLSELILATEKKINSAADSTEKLKKRTQIITNKLKSVETIGMDESNAILEINHENDDYNEDVND